MAETIKEDQPTLVTKRNLPEESEQKQPSSSKNRITDLPEDIMHNILSFLTVKDAVKICAASRKWKSLTTSIPNGPNLLFHATPLNCEEVDRFASFVDKTLMSRPSSLRIKKFLLNFPYRDRLEDQVDSWLQFAISHQVEELSLTLDKYRWPNCLVRNSSVRKLSLTSLSKYDEDIAGWCWTSLKVISLNKTWLDTNMIRCILRGSPLIERLTLRQCKFYTSGSNNCMIDTSCTSLKELVMDGCDLGGHWVDQKDLEILGPNLLSLTLVGHIVNIKSFRLSHPTSLVEAHIGFVTFDFVGFYKSKTIIHVFRLIRRVKKLTVGARCVQLISQMRLNGVCLPQPLTCKVLKIEMARLDKRNLPGIAALLRSSPYLEQLIMDGKLRDDEDGKCCDFPVHARVRKDNMEENYWRLEKTTFVCLKSVEIIRFNAKSYPEGSQILSKIVQCLLENAKVLAKLSVHVDGLESEIRESLLQYPRASPNAVVVFKH